eukprot:890110-Amphidinium_carterae.1
MHDAGCQDAGLYDSVQGITLVGELPRLGECPMDLRLSTVKLEALDAMCGATRRRVATTALSDAETGAKYQTT